jgi:hypothetical protein
MSQEMAVKDANIEKLQRRNERLQTAMDGLERKNRDLEEQVHSLTTSTSSSGTSVTTLFNHSFYLVPHPTPRRQVEVLGKKLKVYDAFLKQAGGDGEGVIPSGGGGIDGIDGGGGGISGTVMTDLERLARLRRLDKLGGTGNGGGAAVDGAGSAEAKEDSNNRSPPRRKDAKDAWTAGSHSRPRGATVEEGRLSGAKGDGPEYTWLG